MNKPDNDPVNHPSHYTQGGVECIEAIEAALGPRGFISFLRGQVIKYNWRLESKEHPVQDAEKAQWYGALLVKKLKEDCEERTEKKMDDAFLAKKNEKLLQAQADYLREVRNTKANTQAVPTIQSAALTEKKASHVLDTNSNDSNTFANSCFLTGKPKRACPCTICTQKRAFYRSQS